MDAKFLEYCVKTNVLSQAMLDTLQSESSTGLSPYIQLVRMKAISQEQLAVSAGEFYQCQVVDLSKVKPEPRATTYGSANECRRLQFIPFAIEPAGGLLVALVDYTLQASVRLFLRSARVERMKFYIAPVNTLHNMLDSIYGKQEPQDAVHTRSKRCLSVLRTQYGEFDLANLRMDSPNQYDSSAPQGDSVSVDARKLQAITLELTACKEDNAQLRHRIDQLTSALELESAMLRSLAKILTSNGIMDAKLFEQWLSSQR